MREEGVFTWDRMYGEEYALADIHDITREFRQELTLATSRLAQIFTRVVPVLQQAEDSLLLELGVPQQALQAVRIAISQAPPTIIGRFDFAQTAEGLKMLEQLRVWKDRLYVRDGQETQPVDVLYRLHALEKLAEEQDEDGYPTGAHVLQLIAEQKLAIMNPPSAFLIQTKALQALIWNLHEAGEFFTSEEHDIIDRHMLPTYFENRFAGVADYVTKPIFGREGGGVMLFDAQGSVVEKDQEEFYWDQPMIFQKRVELPAITVNTSNGAYDGRLLWGSFWIGGEASALVARVGGPITNNMSYYLPVGIKG
jgi:glutathionylspermidine synthase